MRIEWRARRPSPAASCRTAAETRPVVAAFRRRFVSSWSSPRADSAAAAERDHVRVLAVLELLEALEREARVEEGLEEEPEREVRGADACTQVLGRDAGRVVVALG